jgi:hypothetical protein
MLPRMHRAVAAIVVATFLQVFLVTANAAAPVVHLSGTAVDVQTGRPVSGVLVQFFPQSSATHVISDTTNVGGRFDLLIPAAEQLTSVILYVSDQGIPCTRIRLEGVVGVATAYAAARETPTFSPVKPTPIQNPDSAYAIFPVGIGRVDPCGWMLGAAGHQRSQPLE